MEKDIIRETIAGIDKEIKNLDELRKEFEEIKTRKTLVYKRSKGSIFHDFYNCCERVFKTIAMEINGGFEESERWHKALLYKMTMPIEGLRPRIISDVLAARLDEFLAFRHVFRNIYGFELKGDRIDYLSERFDKTAKDFVREVKAFIGFLRKELKG